MRAYIHGFQGRPWNHECRVAAYGFRDLGVETVLFTTNEEFDTRNPEDVVVGGTIIFEKISRLENQNYTDILCYRYIYGYTIKRIMGICGCNERWVFRVLQQAKKEYERMNDHE